MVKTGTQDAPRILGLISKVPWGIQLYLVFLLAYSLTFGTDVVEAIAFPEWLIAPVMLLGSFVAGSTCLGGGAVAFPALTKVFATDPFVAKTFSLAIQSAGMTSASLYIIYKVSNLPYKFIGIYLAGAIAGLMLSLVWFDGLFAAGDIRIGFTFFVLCFFVMYLYSLKRDGSETLVDEGERRYHMASLPVEKQHVPMILFCGALGGVISGLLGSGADLIGFCVLALFYRIDIRLATQVSVIIMACVSLIGVFTQAFVLQNIPSQVVQLWLIAAPVVVLGAPIGAIVCKNASKRFLLWFVSMIITVEVISTVVLVEFEIEKLTYYLLLICLAPLFLKQLHKRSPYKP